MSKRTKRIINKAVKYLLIFLVVYAFYILALNIIFRKYICRDNQIAKDKIYYNLKYVTSIIELIVNENSCESSDNSIMIDSRKEIEKLYLKNINKKNTAILFEYSYIRFSGGGHFEDLIIGNGSSCKLYKSSDRYSTTKYREIILTKDTCNYIMSYNYIPIYNPIYIPVIKYHFISHYGTMDAGVRLNIHVHQHGRNKDILANSSLDDVERRCNINPMCRVSSTKRLLKVYKMVSDKKYDQRLEHWHFK